MPGERAGEGLLGRGYAGVSLPNGEQLALKGRTSLLECSIEPATGSGQGEGEVRWVQQEELNIFRRAIGGPGSVSRECVLEDSFRLQGGEWAGDTGERSGRKGGKLAGCLRRTGGEGS